MSENSQPTSDKNLSIDQSQILVGIPAYNEETVPCVTLRENTERPETIDVGANRLVGTQPSDIVEGAQAMSGIEANWEQPFGDGIAAIQILNTVVETGSQEGAK